MKLAGVRVLDLSQFLPGPHLTMTMADHGADVIMVEPKNGTGEPVRAMGTRAADGKTVWFRNIARGKRSIALDLKNKDDLNTFLRLADEADVIVEAFRPGVAARLGIGYDAIAARNPRIVYCSISASGRTAHCATSPRTISACRRWPARSICHAAFATTSRTCPISSLPTWRLHLRHCRQS
jgi:crotonobetainyl-CoA:carnitine CoA-transferase CaiB-like acyl-CoA transferase